MCVAFCAILCVLMSHFIKNCIEINNSGNKFNSINIFYDMPIIYSSLCLMFVDIS